MRRLWLLLLPALALIGWGIAAQLPRWTAPQPAWFPAGTPGVCAAVEALRVYEAVRVESDGTGVEAARSAAAQVVSEHYDTEALAFSEPLAVQAALPGDQRRSFYVVTAKLSAATAILYLDAESGEARALITTPDSETSACDFDVREALIAAVKSAPTILLGAYILLTAGALIVRRLVSAKGKH
ncbi:MAG: hypothetical protein ABI835_11105 [Chloroflexota bacterium]